MQNVLFPQEGANRTANSPPKAVEPEEIVSKGGHRKRCSAPASEGHGDLHPVIAFRNEALNNRVNCSGDFQRLSVFMCFINLGSGPRAEVFFRVLSEEFRDSISESL